MTSNRLLGLIVVVALVLSFAVAGSDAPGSARANPAAPVLTIRPASWGVVGLDSNNVNIGPNVFMIGARVCNTGDATATNLVSIFVWDSANALINLKPGSNSSLTYPALAAGACTFFNYDVEITRSAAAYDTTRGYHITVTADTLPVISTPTPRELYVEHLVSQARNDIVSITGPTNVVVGGTYTYVVIGATAPQGYEQIVNSVPFANAMFHLQNIAVTYTAPPGGTNDQEYADACGWDPIPGSPTYRSCIGPPNYAGGKAGGDPISTTYTVLVTGPGVTSLIPIIYDFSGSSYHYNTDYGFSIVVTSTLATATPTATNTPLPPTATNTPLPPTATPTNVPAGVAVTGVTARTGDGSSALWSLLAAGALVAAAGLALTARRARR
jgi:hypothetical protein